MTSLGFTQDLTYAVRTMRRAPAFTAVAVLTLAAGIGVNTAMFSVVDRVLMRPLPYAHAESLFVLWNKWAGTDRASLSNPEFLDFRERLRSADVAAYNDGSDNLTGRGEPQRLITYMVAQRQRDIAVRVALGAPARDVVGMVIAQGMRPVILGIGIGTTIALAASRVLTSYVFGSRQRRPSTAPRCSSTP